MHFGAIIILAASAVTHPVFPPQFSTENIPSLERQVATAMAMSPRELFDVVPSASGKYFCGCPHCDGGSQEHAMVWELGMGDRVKCRYCGMTFPNEQYPNHREKTITAPSGAVQVYRWYEKEDGRQYYYEARAWYERMRWTCTMALRLANLYALTSQPEYGDRAAAIVGRYAQVYPDYAIRFDYPFAQLKFWPANQKWPYEGINAYRGAKFYWWGYGDIPQELVRAYDLLASGDAFERMKELLGDGIRERIERDLIRMSYDFVAANPDAYTNMSPGMYEDMIVAGRVIGAPEMVHEAVTRFRTLVAKQFFFDGWWRECAPSYHWQTIHYCTRVAHVAKGYSDPPDWPAPRFDNLDLASDVPLLAKAFRAGKEACLPDGRVIPINDSWWNDKQQPLEASAARMWSGMGHAALGAGEGAHQIQAHINWNAAFGHHHMDSAAIILYAFGKELLSDIGYTHTRYRNWTINSASHNLVVVDERSQPLESDNPTMMGDVLFFDDSHPHVQAIVVDARRAYPQCTVYCRRLVLIHIAEGQDYLVDVFDVEGGTTHDYFLHGCADEEGTCETDVSVEQSVETLVPAWGGNGEYTGENCVDVRGEKYHAYAFLRDILSGPTNGPCRATWRYGNIGLRTYLFPEDGTMLYRFWSPAIRRAGEIDAKLEEYRMNGLMLRHTGGRSRFAAVHVPFETEPWVASAHFNDNAFTVTHGAATETIRWDNDRLVVESSSGWRYDSGAPVQGSVAAVERGDPYAIIADREVPHSRWIRLDFGDVRRMMYPVKSADGNRMLLQDDPGFAYDPVTGSSEFLYHPQERLPGPLTWVAWAVESNSQ